MDKEINIQNIIQNTIGCHYQYRFTAPYRWNLELKLTLQFRKNIDFNKRTFCLFKLTILYYITKKRYVLYIKMCIDSYRVFQKIQVSCGWQPNSNKVFFNF